MDPFDILIENLKGNVPLSTSYMPKENAHQELVRMSGEDWGYDAAAWQARKSEILKKVPRLSDDERKAKEIEIRKRAREMRSKPPA